MRPFVGLYIELMYRLSSSCRITGVYCRTVKSFLCWLVMPGTK